MYTHTCRPGLFRHPLPLVYFASPLPLTHTSPLVRSQGSTPYALLSPLPMTPIQHSLYSHLPPPEEGNHHHQVYLHPFLPTYETSSYPCAIFLSSCQEGSSEGDQQHSHLPQQLVKEHFFSSGTSDHGSAPRSPTTVAEGGESRHKNGAGEGDPSDGGSGRWMSSKMRFMRKMMGSDKVITHSKPRKSALGLQDQQGKIGDSNHSDNNNSNNSPPSCGTIRVCSDCNTTKTPLWRSGPRGPKSLCNACGIRQRKARRAMAAAAAITGVVIPAAVAPAKVRKEKRSAGRDCSTVPFKKRFKFTAAAQNRKQLHLDLTKSSTFHRVFPQDEKEEAAILLMALSCGLIRS